jgi:hypothetical protein
MTMKKRHSLTLSQKAEKALKEAVRNVVKEHKRTGDPLVVWQNGKVVKISPDRL